MSRLGDKVDRGRVPGLDRLKARVASFGLWSRVVDRVMRRPLLWGGVTTALLVALTIPAFSMQTGTPDMDTLPHKYPVVQTFERLTAAFPTENSSASVVVEAEDVTAPQVRPRSRSCERAIGASTRRCSPAAARSTWRSAPTRRSRRCTSASPATGRARSPTRRSTRCATT